MSARIDASTLLHRALIADAARSGIAIEIATTTTTRWASATFVGGRHRVTLSGFPADAAEKWLEGLVEADLPLRRHLVADLVVVEQARAGDGFTATIEVLTVEEA